MHFNLNSTVWANANWLPINSNYKIKLSCAHIYYMYKHFIKYARAHITDMCQRLWLCSLKNVRKWALYRYILCLSSGKPGNFQVEKWVILCKIYDKTRLITTRARLHMAAVVQTSFLKTMFIVRYIPGRYTYIYYVYNIRITVCIYA